MNYPNKLKGSLLVTTMLLLSIASVNAQEMVSNKGVVVSKSKIYNTITVRDKSSGTRNTYLKSDSTALKSTDGPIKFEDIKRGQDVNLKFSETDTGRELFSFDIADLDQLVEIVPVTVTDIYTIKGKITGTRPALRTITILPEDRKRRLTLNVPNETNIVFNGKSSNISDLKKGDIASFKYRETDTGYILVSDTTALVPSERAVESTANEAEYNNQNAIAAELPSTASNRFALLLTSLVLALSAFGLGFARKDAA